MVKADAVAVQDFLEDVRKRAVSQVVQERGGAGLQQALGLDGLAHVADDAGVHLARQVAAAHAVSKARVLSAVKHQVDEAILADVTQALKLAAVDKLVDKPAKRGIGLGLHRRWWQARVDAVVADLVVNGVAIKLGSSHGLAVFRPVEAKRRIGAAARNCKQRRRQLGYSVKGGSSDGLAELG